MTEPIFDITSYNPQTKQIRARLHPSAREKRGPWRWPLGKLAGRQPIVLDDHVTADRRGVDLGYVIAPFDSELYVPVYAVQSGEVSFAHEGPDGCAVSLDHGKTTTHYAQMSKMFVTRCLGKTRRRQYARAGDVIGYAAKSPVHVRFELWKWTDDRGFVAIDPRPELEGWTVPSPLDELRLPSNPRNPTNEAA
jgi:murein DD-endopeptidase MepM/ murein hydrolase activator NlpD